MNLNTGEIKNLNEKVSIDTKSDQFIVGDCLIKCIFQPAEVDVVKKENDETKVFTCELASSSSGDITNNRVTFGTVKLT